MDFLWIGRPLFGEILEQKGTFWTNFLLNFLNNPQISRFGLTLPKKLGLQRFKVQFRGL